MTERRERPAADESFFSKTGSVSLLGMMAVLVRERRAILAFTVAGMVLGVALALLREKNYTTTFSFVPQSTQEPGRAGLASLAGQFGISLGALGGAAESPQLYADLLGTRAVLGPIAMDSFPVDRDSLSRVPLAVFLNAVEKDAAMSVDKTIRALRANVIATTVASRTTGMVTVRVRTESPYVSLALAERLMAGLNHFNLVTRQSRARQERIFTEGRLEAARESLRSAEDALQGFLEANRQVATSPALTFQRDRLQRVVQLRQQLVTSLAQSYEENRIREVRDTPVITVIETPTLPVRPDPRRRLFILFVSTVAAFAAGSVFVTWRAAWTTGPAGGSDPALALLSLEWKRMRGVAAS